MELSPSLTITFPNRFYIRPTTAAETVQEINNLAQVLVTSTDAITGLYFRLCDTIRNGTLTDIEVRKELLKHFPHSRASEIMRVAYAPPEVYDRYTAGFFGFRAALKQCRLYHIMPGSELTMRQARRAAERLIKLLGDAGRIRVKDKLVIISPLNC